MAEQVYVKELPMCPEGKHNPFHRGIVGGWKCAKCGAVQYDLREPWIPSSGWRNAAASPSTEEPKNG